MAIFQRQSKIKSTGFSYAAGSSPSSATEVIELARRKGLKIFPIDLDGLAQCVGIVVRRYPLEGERSGYIKKEEGRVVIGINSLHHPKRQRFTLAHELGHFFLHSRQHSHFEDTILLRDTSFVQDGVEYEANQFAADLLMPEQEFRQLITDTRGDITELSDQISVSTIAITIRAKQLGYKLKG